MVVNDNPIYTVQAECQSKFQLDCEHCKPGLLGFSEQNYISYYRIRSKYVRKEGVENNILYFCANFQAIAGIIFLLFNSYSHAILLKFLSIENDRREYFVNIETHVTNKSTVQS